MHPFNDSHNHIDFMYLVRSNVTDFTPNEDESPIIQWFTIDEIEELNKNKELFDGTLDICNWVFDKYM